MKFKFFLILIFSFHLKSMDEYFKQITPLVKEFYRSYYSDFKWPNVCVIVKVHLEFAKKGIIDINKTFNEIMDFHIDDYYFKYTPLHFAVNFTEPELVEEILDVPNLDVNQTDDSGWSVLHRASLKGSSFIVKLLLKHPRINFSLKTPEGKSFLDATTKCHTNCYCAGPNYIAIANVFSDHLKEMKLLGEGIDQLAMPPEVKNIVKEYTHSNIKIKKFQKKSQADNDSCKKCVIL